MPNKIEEPLAAWREADRRLQDATDGNRETLEAEVERQRNAFQQLSVEQMGERIGALKEAEFRRATATPSTVPFHQAARDEKTIATEIWEMARASDEDSPPEGSG